MTNNVYEPKVEDIEAYEADIKLNGLEILYVHLVCQSALKDKKSRRRLGVYLSLVKNLNKKLQDEIKLIEEFCKAVGE